MTVMTYQCSDDCVEQDSSELVKERSCGHEVAGLHDDGRQDDGEEHLRVELNDFVLITAEVRYDSQGNSDHYQQTALWT